MPNGLSGGFSLSKETLQLVLNGLPADAAVGQTAIRLKEPLDVVDVSAMCRMVSEYPDDLILVEEHNNSYVVRLEPIATSPPNIEKWIMVFPKSPLFEELRRQHLRHRP